MKFTSYSALQKEINRRAGIAVQNTAVKVVEYLRQYVKEDYYDVYDPQEYVRTYQFMNSPMYEMLEQNVAKIFINTGNMHYKEVSGDWVARMASLGLHGGSIFVEGYFWKDFIEWAEENVPRLLKEELRKQGLNVK